MKFDDVEAMLYQVFGEDRDISKITIWKPGNANRYIFGSTLACGKLEFRSQQKFAVHVFLKAYLEEGKDSPVNTALILFNREKIFYTNILPLYSTVVSEFFEDRNMFLKFYGVGKTLDGIYLVLEDFKMRGYEVTSGREFHHLNLIKNVMGNLAVFHASYFHIKNKSQISEFLDKSEIFLPTHRQNLERMFIRQFKTVLKTIKIVSAEVINNNNIFQKHGIKSISKDLLMTVTSFSDDIMNILLKIATRKNEFTSLCHGDFYMWNIAKDSKEKVKFFDFQTIRVATLVTDILQYLYSVSDPKFRGKHLMEVLEIYCDEFNEFCRKSNIDKCIDKEGLFREYKFISIWGFIYAFTFLLRRFIGKDIFKYIENINDEKEVLVLLTEKAPQDDFWNVFNIYYDLVEEADAMDSFKYIKEFSS